MAEAYLAKTARGYLPADEQSSEQMKSIAMGAVIKVKYTAARDFQKHKRFWKFISVTFHMQEHFEELEHYRRWLIMKAGWYDAIVTPKGDTIFVAKSISFSSMEQDEFDRLFSACIDTFLRELGKGMTESDILAVIDFS